MDGFASTGRQSQPALDTLNRRAEAILKARPAYKEMVDFYLTIFRRQIEWRDRLRVHPETVDQDEARSCLAKAIPLAEHYDPGIDPDSLLELWTEMKVVFRRGNDVLRAAIEKIERAEETDRLAPAAWLAELRPDRAELVSDACTRIGVEESVLSTLARAVTFPHWNLVARSWLPGNGVDTWGRSCCPTCGGAAALAETRPERRAQADVSGGVRRFLHCAFCGTRWPVPGLKCLVCGSVKAGDAKYLFTSDEPDWRIDFCKSCRHYVKVIEGKEVPGPIHVGLEMLTSAHLDTIAQEKNLSPLEMHV